MDKNFLKDALEAENKTRTRLLISKIALGVIFIGIAAFFTQSHLSEKNALKSTKENSDLVVTSGLESKDDQVPQVTKQKSNTTDPSPVDIPQTQSHDGDSYREALLMELEIEAAEKRREWVVDALKSNAKQYEISKLLIQYDVKETQETRREKIDRAWSLYRELPYGSPLIVQGNASPEEEQLKITTANLGHKANLELQDAIQTAQYDNYEQTWNTVSKELQGELKEFSELAKQYGDMIKEVQVVVESNINI